MRMRLVLVILVLALAAPVRGEVPSGEALFREHCASCHAGGVERAPDVAALRQMSRERLSAALTTGVMQERGAALMPAQREALVAFLAAKTPAQAAIAPVQCGAPPPPMPAEPLALPHWNGWGADAAERRFQPAAMAGLAAADVPRLKLKWAFGFPGVNRAYAQPAVLGGRLFIGSAGGTVYSLDARTGCVIWTFIAGIPVRTAISIGREAGGWTAYFADQHATAYAVDALTGKLIWQKQAYEHPSAVVTGAPVLAGSVLYVPVTSGEEVAGANPNYRCCTFRGSVAALDAATGELLWQGYTIAEPPKPVRQNTLGIDLFGPSGAGVWSAPSLDPATGMIYVTTGDSYSDPAAPTSDAFVALRMATGAIAWSRQMTAGDAYTIACNSAAPGQGNCPNAGGPDFDFGASPMLVTLPDGHRALIAGQKSGVVHAIDPDRQGEVLWQRRVGSGGKMGGVEWGSAADDRHVYVAVSDVRTRPVAADTPGAQRSVFGPSFELDPHAGGGLYALDLATGAVVWHTPHPGCGDRPGCSPAQSAAVTAIPGVVFSGGLDGHLRAYAAESGQVIWDVDTKRDYPTVNGVPAHGGSLDGPGAVVVGGMLYVNSGYAFLGAAPGNVLLAFSVDGN